LTGAHLQTRKHHAVEEVVEVTLSCGLHPAVVSCQDGHQSFVGEEFSTCWFPYLGVVFLFAPGDIRLNETALLEAEAIGSCPTHNRVVLNRQVLCELLGLRSAVLFLFGAGVNRRVKLIWNVVSASWLPIADIEFHVVAWRLPTMVN